MADTPAPHFRLPPRSDHMARHVVRRLWRYGFRPTVKANGEQFVVVIPTERNCTPGQTLYALKCCTPNVARAVEFVNASGDVEWLDLDPS